MVAGLIHFAHAISGPSQIAQKGGIVLALARGFLQKTVSPGEIAALVRHFSRKGGDLGIGWRQLARFLCVRERFLLVLERPGIELGELRYDEDQLGIHA